MQENHIRNFKLFEAHYYHNIEYQMKCLRMLLSDLKSMLEGLKNKIYCKTFKQFTEWDHNYLKFLQCTLVSHTKTLISNEKNSQNEH